MALFDWGDALLTAALWPDVVQAHDVDQEGAARAALRSDRAQVERLKMERTRWLEEHRAERSFPCGLAPLAQVDVGEPRLNVLPSTRAEPVQVTAAVLTAELAFLHDGRDDVIDVGRLPRTAILDVDVLDGSGAHIPEPIHETFEPDLPALCVLRWSNHGVDDEERFAFRSVWLAWKAARKLLSARLG